MPTRQRREWSIWKPTDSFEERRVAGARQQLRDVIEKDTRELAVMRERDSREAGKEKRRARHSHAWTTLSKVARPKPHRVSSPPHPGGSRAARAAKTMDFLSQESRSAFTQQQPCPQAGAALRIAGLGHVSRIFLRQAAVDEARTRAQAERHFHFLLPRGPYPAHRIAFCGSSALRDAVLCPVPPAAGPVRYTVVYFASREGGSAQPRGEAGVLPPATQDTLRAYAACEQLGVGPGVGCGVVAVYEAGESAAEVGALRAVAHVPCGAVDGGSTGEGAGVVFCRGRSAELCAPRVWLSSAVGAADGFADVVTPAGGGGARYVRLPDVLHQGLPMWVHEQHHTCGGFLLSADGVRWTVCPDSLLRSDYSTTVAPADRVFVCDTPHDGYGTEDEHSNGVTYAPAVALADAHEARVFLQQEGLRPSDSFELLGVQYTRMVQQAEGGPQQWTSADLPVYLAAHHEADGGVVLSPDGVTWLAFLHSAVVRADGELELCLPKGSDAATEPWAWHAPAAPSGAGPLPPDSPLVEFRPASEAEVRSAMQGYQGIDTEGTPGAPQAMPDTSCLQLIRLGEADADHSRHLPSYACAEHIWHTRNEAVDSMRAFFAHCDALHAACTTEWAPAIIEDLLRELAREFRAPKQARLPGVLWRVTSTLRDVRASLHRAAAATATAACEPGWQTAFAFLHLQELLTGDTLEARVARTLQAQGAPPQEPYRMQGSAADIADTATNTERLKRLLRKDTRRSSETPTTFRIALLESDAGRLCASRFPVYIEACSPLVAVPEAKRHCGHRLLVCTPSYINVSRALHTLDEAAPPQPQPAASLFLLPAGVYRVDRASSTDGCIRADAVPLYTACDYASEASPEQARSPSPRRPVFSLPFLLAHGVGPHVFVLEVPAAGCVPDYDYTAGQTSLRKVVEERLAGGASLVVVLFSAGLCVLLPAKRLRADRGLLERMTAHPREACCSELETLERGFAGAVRVAHRHAEDEGWSHIAGVHAAAAASPATAQTPQRRCLALAALSALRRQSRFLPPISCFLLSAAPDPDERAFYKAVAQDTGGGTLPGSECD